MKLAARFLLPLVSAALLCGCQSERAYVQKSATGTDAATIYGINETDRLAPANKYQKVCIASVDGVSTHSFGREFVESNAFATVATVSPGRHELRVKYIYSGGFSWAKLWLDAEAGKSYHIRKKIRGYHIFFWIEEDGTGRIVGGVPGPEPENVNPPPLATPQA